MQDGALPYPSIAQLAERETVEARQLSLGHWFESGWTETFFQVHNALPSSPNWLKSGFQGIYAKHLGDTFS